MVPRPIRRRLSSEESPLCPRPVPDASGNRGRVAHLPRKVSWLRREKDLRSPAFAQSLPGVPANARNRACPRAQELLPVFDSQVSFFVIACFERKKLSANS